DALDAPPVVVINETMARRYWSKSDAVGRKIRRASQPSDAPWVTIVGVAADVRHANLVDPPRPEIYWPQAQRGPLEMTLVARTVSSNPLSLAPSIRQQIWKVDRNMPLFEIQSMDEVIDRRTAGPRSLAKVMGGPAAIALLMAGLGLYGVLAF